MGRRGNAVGGRLVSWEHVRTQPSPTDHPQPVPAPARPSGIGLRFALRGIVVAYRGQRNLRIQAAVGLAAAMLAGLLPLGPVELCLVALTIGAVVGAELLNTALEAAVDLASPEVHPLARTAKDAAAGAVVVLCTASLVVGTLLFLPPLLRLELRPGGWAWALGLLLLGIAIHIALWRFPLAFDASRDYNASHLVEGD